MGIVNVLIPAKVDGLFSYVGNAPDGAVVGVSFGRRSMVGVVWEQAAIAPTKTLKEVQTIHDILPLSLPLRRFVDWMAEYTLTPKGLVLKQVLSGYSVVKKPRASAPQAMVTALPTLALSDAQRDIALALMAKPGFAVQVLDGVTGSGKTEVYLAALEQHLQQGKQGLIMLPEIALTTQVVTRLEQRLGRAAGVWHSGVTPAQKRRLWLGVADGSISLIVGARSALFLPFQKLGLVIVDEEHDASYKQEEQIIYHARDMAIARARLEDCPVVLASATPSLETIYNIHQGKYHHHQLPTRYHGVALPTMHLIDMRKQGLHAQQWLSEPLRRAVQQTLNQQQQAMLFINRRGYAPLTLCRSCGHRWQCPSCSAWLVAHKHNQRLQCHHCGYHAPLPKACPACGEEDSLIACGPGVERIAEEAKRAFPQARILTLSTDTLEDAQGWSAIVERIHNKEVDILVGTQLLAKGHHFPHLHMVGIMDADASLMGGDIRAGEKTFQLLQQVAGRAGREGASGHVYVQTWQPESAVMRHLATQQRDAFYDALLAERHDGQLPPYGRLAALIISGSDEARVLDYAHRLSCAAAPPSNITVLGPAPAMMVRLRGHYRYRFLVKSEKNIKIQLFISQWLARVPCPSALKCVVDIDPQGFY